MFANGKFKAAKPEGGRASAGIPLALFSWSEEEEERDVEDIRDGAVAGIAAMEAVVSLME